MAVHEYFDDERRDDVKHLSNRELAWIERLEKTLAACPTKRLALVTMGDPSLLVIDNTITHKYNVDLHDGLADANGVVLARIDGKPLVHGVSA